MKLLTKNKWKLSLGFQDINLPSTHFQFVRKIGYVFYLLLKSLQTIVVKSDNIFQLKFVLCNLLEIFAK